MSQTCSVMPLRPLLAAVACAIGLTLGLALPAGGTALTESERLRQVEEQIETHHEKIEASHIKALNLEQELHRIDAEIAKSQATLVDLQGQLQKQENEIHGKEREIERIHAEKDIRAAHVKRRLAAYSITGEVGIINALFSATELGDLLNLQEYVQTLFRHDQKALDDFRSQLTLLAEAKEGLARAKEQLQVLIDQVKESEKALMASREERDKLLAQARTEVELYRQATQALEEMAAKLTAAIEKERQQELKEARKRARRTPKVGSPLPFDTGFSANKGRMPPPALGRIIKHFGPYRDAFGNELRSDGIDLDVPPETPVTAIHHGRVIFADTMPGYGNLIIIDHGAQYYSLISGIDSLAKAKDDTVNAGDVLGVVGQPSGLINPGLHVEIRHGSTPEDPIPWFDTSRLESSLPALESNDSPSYTTTPGP